MASITKYKNNKGTFYRAVVYIGLDQNGKQKQKKKSGFKTKKEATIWANKLELERGVIPLESYTGTLTVEQAYQEWIALHARRVKETTVISYNSVFNNHIIPLIGKVKLNKLRAYHCQLVADRLIETNKKSYDVAFNKFCLFIKSLHDMNYITKKHTATVVLPKMQKTKSENYWTKEQLNTFLDYTSKNLSVKYQALYRLLAFSGLRIGEVCALTWSSVNFKHKCLKVHKSVTTSLEGKRIIGTTKTEASADNVFVDDETLNLLHKLRLESFKLGAAKDDNLIFLTFTGKNLYSNIRRTLKRHIEKAGLPQLTPHGFRHTHASLLFESGADLKAISERLRHANVATTANTYVHLNDKKKQETANLFADYIANS